MPLNFDRTELLKRWVRGAQIFDKLFLEGIKCGACISCREKVFERFQSEALSDCEENWEVEKTICRSKEAQLRVFTQIVFEDSHERLCELRGFFILTPHVTRSRKRLLLSIVEKCLFELD